MTIFPLACTCFMHWTKEKSVTCSVLQDVTSQEGEFSYDLTSYACLLPQNMTIFPLSCLFHALHGRKVCHMQYRVTILICYEFHIVTGSCKVVHNKWLLIRTSMGSVYTSLLLVLRVPGWQQLINCKLYSGGHF